MEEKKSKKKRNIVIAGLGALVAIYFAFLDVTWLPRHIKWLMDDYKIRHIHEELAGDAEAVQVELDLMVTAHLDETQDAYGYQGYKPQYMLTKGAAGFGAEITIVLMAEWDEETLLTFGKGLCQWSECLVSGEQAVLDVWPSVVVKLEGNGAFWFAGSGEEGAVRELVYAEK